MDRFFFKLTGKCDHFLIIFGRTNFLRIQHINSDGNKTFFLHCKMTIFHC